MFQRIVILSISLNFLFALNSQPAHSQTKTLMQDGGLVFQEQYYGQDYQWKMESKDTNFYLSYSLSTGSFTPEMSITPTGYLVVRGDIVTPYNGNVGIGTFSPNERLEVAGNGRAFFGDGGGDSRTGLLIDGNEPGYYARLEAYDYGEKSGMALVLNTVGGGNVGIGTTDPDYLLEVNGPAGKPGGGSWSNSSDVRLKNITGDYDAGLNEIVDLRPVNFFYKEGNPRGLPTDHEYIGFIAQEVEENCPEAVSEGPDGYLDFNMHPVNVAVVNAIKELKAENDTLKVENESLKNRIKKIEALLGI